LVDDACVQPEAGDEQEGSGQQQEEQPVGERAREQTSSDGRVPLEQAEPDLDGRVTSARLLEVPLDDPDPFAHAGSTISAGNSAASGSGASSCRTRASK